MRRARPTLFREAFKITRQSTSQTLLAEAVQGDDAVFDALLPEWASAPSKIHWTPLNVVRKVVSVFCHRPGVRVLDVGSGAGKFCLAGAALAEDCVFTGVEQRRALVENARSFASKHQLTNAHFVCADAFDQDWSDYDALYFYNPFAEHIFMDPADRIRCGDEVGSCDIEWSSEQHRRYVTETYRRLQAAEPGLRVATYHGFGRDMPPGFTQIYASGQKKSQLRIWQKTDWY